VSRYASDTVVPIDRSRSEIERILSRYGAEAFMYATKPDRAMIAFQVKGRHVRMVLPMPTERDEEISLDRWGRKAKGPVIQKRIEQEARRRWRAMALVIKAKLEAVTSGIAVFEDEFLAYMVLPNDVTVGEWARPQLAQIYESGKMPKLLPSGME
jgi:hypothetical protein